MFLKSGSRRVIFEGRECGGHVGPRTSFVLWELMTRVILAHLAETGDRGETYHVLFAGGIHDARSAAMVASLSAPLSARGVRVGVLLGTSYLFTEEAVASGAIVDWYQKEAIACTQTSLLESGVGHATRCASTPFERHFRETKHRLIREGRAKERSAKPSKCSTSVACGSPRKALREAKRGKGVGELCLDGRGTSASTGCT